ncbi:MAG: alpha-1,2-fucosyltransferase [bacterium]|nr:alpha-1,2-fucosyltransferase [bacterium]
MSVIFAKLGKYGRLGNSLFQIAATVAHANKNNDSYAFPHWEYEKDFNIPKECFIDNVFFKNTFEEPHFHYAGIPYKEHQNLFGYFQSYKYFQDDSKIKSLLRPKCAAWERPDTGKTSIHVRRDDYLIHKNCYNILTMNNYYEKAMELSDSKKFLVFSDDMPWCKKHFIGNQFEFSEGKTPVEDLGRMLKCQHHIIANSSFSWWGAYLGKNNKVIAPKIWFGSQLAPTHDTKDLLPSDWLRI